VKLSKVSILDEMILVGFYLSGFAALTYEQIWTQLLILIFGASTYAFSAVLTTFFFGLALGSYLMGRYVDRLRMPILWFSFIELGIGLSGLLLLPAFSYLDLPYLYLYHKIMHPEFFILTWLFLPFLLAIPTTLMGATLPIISKVFTSKKETIGGDVGMIYSANTLGGIVGSFCAGFLLIPYIGVEKTYILAVLSNVIVASVLFFYSARLLNIQDVSGSILGPHFRRMKYTFYGLLAVSFFVMAQLSTYSIDPGFAGAYYTGMRLSSVEEWIDAKESFETLYHKYGLYGLVSVGSDGQDIYLSTNGKTEASTGPADAQTQYLISYLPLIVHPNPEKVLNIGLGAGFTLSAIENVDVEQIDCVEIDPLVVRLADGYFSEYTHDALQDPRLQLIIADGRHWLANTPRKYDVIVSEPSNPWISGVGTLFTREYFKIVKDHLEEGGIFCQWAPMYEQETEDFAVLLNTFRSVFPHVQLYNAGTDMILMGSTKQMQIDYQRLAKIIDGPEVKEDFDEMQGLFVGDGPQLIDEMILSTYKMSTEDVDAYLRGKKLSMNTDDRAVLEFRTAKNAAKKRYQTEAAAYILPLKTLIDFKRERTGPVTRPPVVNLVGKDGSRDVLDFLGVVVETGPSWVVESAGFEFVHMVHKEGAMGYSSSRHVRYALPENGKLAILPLEGYGMPGEDELSNMIRNIYGTDSVALAGGMPVGGHQGMVFEISAAGGNVAGYVLVWRCDGNNRLYTAAVVYPVTTWDEEKGAEALSRIECIHN
jgi:spermidine synthase